MHKLAIIMKSCRLCSNYNWYLNTIDMHLFFIWLLNFMPKIIVEDTIKQLISMFVLQLFHNLNWKLHFTFKECCCANSTHVQTGGWYCTIPVLIMITCPSGTQYWMVIWNQPFAIVIDNREDKVLVLQHC